MSAAPASRGTKSRKDLRPKHQHASIRLDNNVDSNGKPRKQWVQYEDGSYEPVAQHGDIRKKKRENGKPDWWVVDKHPSWSPPEELKAKSSGNAGTASKQKGVAMKLKQTPGGVPNGSILAMGAQADKQGPGQANGNTKKKPGYPQEGPWYMGLPDCPQDRPEKDQRWPEEDPDITEWIFHDNADCVRSPQNRRGHRQQCCYDENGNLITSGGGAGTPDKRGDVRQHFVEDVLPWFNMDTDDYHEKWPPNQGKRPQNHNK